MGSLWWLSNNLQVFHEVTTALTSAASFLPVLVNCVCYSKCCLIIPGKEGLNHKQLANSSHASFLLAGQLSQSQVLKDLLEKDEGVVSGFHAVLKLAWGVMLNIVGDDNNQTHGQMLLLMLLNPTKIA